MAANDHHASGHQPDGHREPGSRVLILTNSELGQANVVFALILGLLEQDPTLDIHISSFQQLQRPLDTFSALTTQSIPSAKPITFHPLPGRPMFAAMGTDQPDPHKNFLHTSSFSPGLFTTPLFIRVYLQHLMLCWPAPELSSILTSLLTTLAVLNPDLIICDSLFSPGITASIHHRTLSPSTPLAIITPNTPKDFLSHRIPFLRRITTFPVGGAGLPTPLPAKYIPLNIFYFLCVVCFMMTDKVNPAKHSEVQRLTGLGSELKIVTGVDLILQDLAPVDKLIVACEERLDFPFLYEGMSPDGSLPSPWREKMVRVGPIVRPARSVREVDGELDAWLKRGKVVLVALGTHVGVTAEEARELGRGLRVVLDAGLRILWKVKAVEGERGAVEGAVREVLGREMDGDRVRVVGWLEAEPPAVLATGRVVCSVHHGGANSYYEAVVNGVPQVVLPPWLDCYDFASRVELLGLGRWGSRQARPRWKADELREALVDVVVGRREKFASRCKELAEICRNEMGGRTAAAREVLDLVKNHELPQK
ncbi:family 1 glycosyltransferase [Podospora aff. communis PSN243]|uniref:Family 1 glycosyltransferase n=1 Tax=Podospora aff. communis PSN243 TaxID=3040156 RepID=A0AAV9GMH1_9PEZI|nr:family 1 glycosyltransferase [Podospora aff. communis PSN243]